MTKRKPKSKIAEQPQTQVDPVPPQGPENLIQAFHGFVHDSEYPGRTAEHIRFYRVFMMSQGHRSLAPEVMQEVLDAMFEVCNYYPEHRFTEIRAPAPGEVVKEEHLLWAEGWFRQAEQIVTSERKSKLGKTAALIYEKLLTLPEHRAMQLGEIAQWLWDKHHINLSDSAICQKHLRKLKPWGLQNDKRIGYSINRNKKT